MTGNVQVIMDNGRRCRGYAQNTFGMVYHKIAIIMWSQAKTTVQVRNLICNQSSTWPILCWNHYGKNTHWYPTAIYRISRKESLHFTDDWSIYEVAKFLCHSKWGNRTTLQIHSGQGRNVMGNLFLGQCKLLEISKTRTSPYRPCAIGQIERYNRTILQSILWHVSISFLATAGFTRAAHFWSIRATVNRQTGFTVKKMRLGRQILQPVDILVAIWKS